MYELIPDELKQYPNWVCWRAVPNPKSHSGLSKQPVNPITGGMAKSNDPTTWSDFQTAVNMSANFAGIGFMFSNSPFFGVDVDDAADSVRDFATGKRDNIIGEFVYGLKSYAEYSQSGNGIHIICKGSLPAGARRKGKVEMYESGRFFVMTGKYISEFVEISDCTESIKLLHAKYLGSKQDNQPPLPYVPPVNAPVSLSEREIIERASNASNGAKFRQLYNGDFSAYNSQSDADMAFCSMLAFWCGGDSVKMDNIYRSSGLMREKWDRKQSGSTYGNITLAKAVSDCREYYTPSKRDDYSISIGGNSSGNDKSRKNYTFDDTGNSQRLYDAYSDIIRYCYIDRKWLYYQSGKWIYDNLGYIRTLADDVVNKMSYDVKYYEIQDEHNGTDITKKFQKHLTKSRSYAGKTNFIKEAEHLISIAPSQFDRHTSLLNCKNGILDLRTGELQQHDKNKYFTKMVQVNYNESAPISEKWLKFLGDIFANDTDTINYIQKVCGYLLTGSTAEQCAFFLYGTGRNGKSTFLEILRYIMGDYATNIQPQTIMVKPNSGNAPNSDIARLKGARLVTSVEPNEGMKLDEGLVKQLTGDDTVTARKLFAEEFEFKPEFKLFMATNHKPTIRGTDTGIWRRIHLIPFTVQIPPEKVNRHLKYHLVAEAEGIFRWCVEGCLKWQKEGLLMPATVKNAVKEYHHEMDVIATFIDECCAEQGEVKASEIYASYVRWASENNEYTMSSTKFGIEMAKRYTKTKKKEGWYYIGISTLMDKYSVTIR